MRKCDELADPNSCLNKAGDNELIFVILERDRAAPATVREWVVNRITNGQNRPEDPKIREALAWVKAVEANRAGRVKGQEKPTCNAANVSAQTTGPVPGDAHGSSQDFAPVASRSTHSGT